MFRVCVTAIFGIENKILAFALAALSTVALGYLANRRVDPAIVISNKSESN